MGVFLVLVIVLGSARVFELVLFSCKRLSCRCLSRTVYVWAGVQFPQSISLLVHCPV